MTAPAPRVGVFRLRYPVVSETFIREQAAALSRYRPAILTRTFEGNGDSPFPIVTVGGDQPPLRSRAARAAYAITAAPGLFGHPRALDDLAVLHAHFAPDAAYALPLAAARRIPLVSSFHGWDVTLPDRSFLGRPSVTTWYFVLHRSALRDRGAAFVAVSEFIRGRLLALGFPASRVVRLYIGVDLEKFRPASRAPGDRYIFSTARHTEQKGVDTLLRAFARIAPRFPDLSLLQVGTGPHTAALNALAVELGIASRVRFLGTQSHDAVRNLMQQATVVALTSQTPPSTGQQEALGLVLNEAGACGVPVVATRHGGMPEAVLDGETGFVRAERDVEGIADALAIIVEDPALAHRFGARGREFVGDVFNLRTQTAALETLYDRVRAEWTP
jgi:glycosyltransferase involved in cell wall biosynthesis